MLQVEMRCCTYYHAHQTLLQNKILLLQVEAECCNKLNSSLSFSKHFFELAICNVCRCMYSSCNNAFLVSTQQCCAASCSNLLLELLRLYTAKLLIWMPKKTIRNMKKKPMCSARTPCNADLQNKNRGKLKFAIEFCFVFYLKKIKIEDFKLSNFHLLSYLCDMNKQDFCLFRSLLCSWDGKDSLLSHG